MPAPKTWVYRYTYHVKWSAEDGQFVATCDEFPSLSWFDSRAWEALQGLEDALTDVLTDMIANGEPIPLPADA